MALASLKLIGCTNFAAWCWMESCRPRLLCFSLSRICVGMSSLSPGKGGRCIGSILSPPAVLLLLLEVDGDADDPSAVVLEDDELVFPFFLPFACVSNLDKASLSAIALLSG